MKLKKGIHTGTNKAIIYTEGNTYPIKDHLKNMGFSWYGAKKFWWLYETKLLPDKLDTLKKLGVDVSEIAGQTASNAPSSSVQSPAPSSPATISNQPKPEKVDSEIVRTDKTTNIDQHSYVSFPINPKIYQTQVQVEANGQTYSLDIIVGRHKDSKYTKTIPMYSFGVYYDKSLLRRYEKQAEGRWSKSGPNYDENSFVENIVNNIKAKLANKEKSKLYNLFLDELKLRKRDPNFSEFLKNWFDFKYSGESPEKEAFEKEFASKVPTRMIKINEEGYEGEYPVSYNLLSNTIYLETDIKANAAPRAATLHRVEIIPDIENIAQLNAYIEKEIIENYAEIQQNYLNYLKSFPFRSEERQEAEGRMRPIAEMIMSGSIDLDLLKRELMKRGFVRPRKSKSEFSPGMVPQGGFKLIIDDKAIRDGVFTRGRSKNDPDYFYSVLAYNLMRIKHNNIGFMPILLVDAYRDLEDILKRYGFNPSRNQVSDYVDKAARDLFADLTGRTYRSWDERWSDFYGGGRGTGSSSYQQSVADNPLEGGRALNNFVSLAVSLGEDAEKARSSPKAVYRQLALKYHPDINEEIDPSIFPKINNAYNALPEHLKRASNWYEKMIKIAQTQEERRHQEYMEKQIEEALSPENKWFCSQEAGYEVTDPNKLIMYYIRNGGAKGFRERNKQLLERKKNSYLLSIP